MPYIQFQFRRDTSINWNSNNPTLAAGEMGIETDTYQFKIGDGSTSWILLPYGGIQGYTGPSGPTGEAGTRLNFLGLNWSNGGGSLNGDYQRDNVVIGSDNNSYICLSSLGSGAQDPTLDTTYLNWILFSISGPTGLSGPSGPPGTPLNFLGLTWSNGGGSLSGDYNLNDVVFGSDNNTYYCLTSLGSGAQDPTLDTTYLNWVMFVMCGQTGATASINVPANSVLWSSDGVSITGSVLQYDGTNVTIGSGYIMDGPMSNFIQLNDGFGAMTFFSGATENINVQGSLIPTIDSTYNLGTTGFRWKDLHLSGNTIYLGDAIISTDSNGNLLFTNSDGSTQTSRDGFGITGERGETGLQGVTGEGVPSGGLTGYVLTKNSNSDYDTSWQPTGNTTSSGNGVTGLQGETGSDGVTGLQGVTGEKGETGSDGVTGLQGVTGEKGETGSDGVTGLQGVTGEKGETGSDGVTGLQGVTGEGVPSGGESGFVLTKISNSDYDTAWLPGVGNSFKMGNVLLVDQNFGNDSTASIGGSSYATINAAITGATSGTTIWVMPGTYNFSSGITIPDGICLRGLNIQTCTIQLLNPTSNTTLLTMGENCRVEDLTLKLTSATDDVNLIGILFTGTSTRTSKLRTCVLTLDNSTTTSTSSSNVYGIHCSGTGSLTESTFSFNCIKGSTINVKSNGSGNKRGILISGSNQVSTRDTNIYVATPSDTSSTGSYVGIETADSSNVGSIQCRSTSIGSPKQLASITFTSSDILQTNPSIITNPSYLASPGIQIGPGTDLVNKTAGGKPFTTYLYPTTIFYCGYGNIANRSTGYLWPGTINFENSRYPDQTDPAARYRIQQNAILSGMSASCNILTGTDTVVITICKNAVGGATLSNPTMFVTTLTSALKSGSFYDGSVGFAAGDYVNVFIDVTGTSLHDLSIQLDMF